MNAGTVRRPLSHTCADRSWLPCDACDACAYTEQAAILDAIKPGPGEKLPKIQTYIYLVPALHDRLRKTAEACEVSLSAFCSQAIKEFLEKFGELE
jgi:hypothetical protein